MILTGIARLGRDAELRYTASSQAVCNLSLAFTLRRKDESGQHPTQWIEAALWGKQAESLQQYLTKGTLLNVSMRDIRIETYQGRNGEGSKLVGTAVEIEFVPGQKNDAEQQERTPPKPAPEKSSETFDDMQDDIPF
jgi:single-strand DNA-binding protein